MTPSTNPKYLLAGVALLAATATSQLFAQPPGGDLWIGVLTYDGASNGDVPANAGVALRPVAALVAGRWHAEPHHAGEGLTAGPGGAVRWTPADRDLPSGWVAWLHPDRREPFTSIGAPRPTGVFDIPSVATGLWPSPPGKDAWSDDVLGVAVSGDVDVSLFTDVTGARRDVVTPLMRQMMVKAEAEEIRTGGADYSAEARRVATEVPFAQWSRAPYEIRVHRVATRKNGTRITELTAFKSLSRADGCNSLRSGVSIEERTSGQIRVLKPWAELICNDLPVTYTPIAIIERDHYACWVGEVMYEDGVEYVLTSPGPDSESPSRTCVIR